MHDFNSQAIVLSLESQNNEAHLRELMGSGKRAGIPVCWKNCHLAGLLFDFLHPASSEKPLLVIDEAPFDIGYMRYDPSLYEDLLGEKVRAVRERLIATLMFPSPEALPVVEVHPSPSRFFRQRCRFSVLHTESSFEYLMWVEDGSPKYVVNTFPIASRHINDAMPILKTGISNLHQLKDSLHSIHFIVSLSGNMIITLFYNKHIDNEWRDSAKKLKKNMELELHDTLSSLQIVGRGCGHSKIVVDKDFIEEVFIVEDGRELRYIQVLDGFSNPNAVVNIKSLDFMISIVKSINGLGKLSSLDDRFDLLEMYCGMGNHTVALAKYSHRVVAVEINKHLCNAARMNLELNTIKNAEVIVADSQDFAQRLLRRKKYVSFSRCPDGEEYSFGAVVVDPPRCGLDTSTLTMIKAYEHIIYISCNPEALCRDLQELIKTHDIQRLAVFDHFPYTPHIETGAYLMLR